MSPYLSFPKLLILQGISALGLLLSSTFSVLAEGVTITSYGHSAVLIEGGGKSVLLNPFKSVGCASDLKEPRISTDVILASSLLADEGAKVAKGSFLVKPGSYRIKGLRIEGFAAPHDRLGGRRFGNATLWRWEQGGMTFAHLGGSAAPLNGESKVLLGRPDVLVIGVGGDSKVYNGEEAAAVIKDLNPKNVIPVQYVTGPAPKNCALSDLKPFLKAMEGTKINQPGKTLKLSKNMPNEIVIQVMNY